MCGIIGVAGSLKHKEETAFQKLLIVDSIRGEDSTGAAFVTRGNEIDVVKTVGDPFQLIETAKFSAGLRKANKCIIGHNRFATTGKVLRKNAHPFQFDTLVGVHNGTLTNKGKLDKATDFDTDSEALYYNIEKKGLSPTIRDVEGAYALVWYDAESDSINFLRNKERPLFFALSQDNKALYWASEAWMIAGVLARENIPINQILQLPEDMHYTFVIPPIDKEFDKAIVRGVKQEKKVFTTGGNQMGTKGSLHIGNEFLKGKAATLIPLTWGKDSHNAHYVSFLSPDYPEKQFRVFCKDEEACKVLHKGKKWNGVIGKRVDNYFKVSFESLVPENKVLTFQRKPKQSIRFLQKDHRGKHLTRNEFEQKYSDCVFCSFPLDFDTEIKIVSDKDCLCANCCSDDEIMKYIPSLI